ncbi:MULTISPECIES: hypothetical protein [unclassified Frankia]|uniref:hypothetical protein n=1 Tax=unclassified Frankia TaxID=2632575 RepID=UPI001EF42123|nr:MULTISPECIES: hypothetical protein [unclassified Frankia]
MAHREDHRGPRGLLFPHAVQAVPVTRRRQPLASGPATTEVIYLATSLPTHQASPTLLATYAREDWLVQNRLHWVRDVAFGKDLSQVGPATRPRSWPVASLPWNRPRRPAGRAWRL